MKHANIIRSTLFSAVAVVVGGTWADEWADSYTGCGAKNAEMGA